MDKCVRGWSVLPASSKLWVSWFILAQREAGRSATAVPPTTECGQKCSIMSKYLYSFFTHKCYPEFSALHSLTPSTQLWNSNVKVRHSTESQKHISRNKMFILQKHHPPQMRSYKKFLRHTAINIDSENHEGEGNMAFPKQWNSMFFSGYGEEKTDKASEREFRIERKKEINGDMGKKFSKWKHYLHSHLKHLSSQ